MDLGLRGRAALVCASTGGLGEAVARALAAEGARVVVSGRRADRAKELAAELPDAVGIAADLTLPGGAAALHVAAVQSVGDLDVLVLNGPGPPPGRASTVTSEQIDAAVGWRSPGTSRPWPPRSLPTASR